MSSSIYPNSATRKLFGQAGQALRNQSKRFGSVMEIERNKILTKAQKEELKYKLEISDLKKSLKKFKMAVIILSVSLLVSIVIHFI